MNILILLSPLIPRLLLTILCRTSLSVEIEEIEVQIRVQNYQDEGALRHLSAMDRNRFRISLFRYGRDAGAEWNKLVESKPTSEPYDRTSFKLPKYLFDKLMKGRVGTKFTQNNKFQILVKAAAPAVGVLPETWIHDFKLMYAMKTVSVVYSLRENRIRVSASDPGPVRSMLFQLARLGDREFVKMKCSSHSQNNWEMEFEEKATQIAFENTVCPQDRYKISLKAINLAKKELPDQSVGLSGRESPNGNEKSEEFEVQCKEACFEPPFLNVYKIWWNHHAQKYECLRNMKKSGKVTKEQFQMEHQNVNSQISPKNSGPSEPYGHEQEEEKPHQTALLSLHKEPNEMRLQNHADGMEESGNLGGNGHSSMDVADHANLPFASPSNLHSLGRQIDEEPVPAPVEPATMGENSVHAIYNLYDFWGTSTDGIYFDSD